MEDEIPHELHGLETSSSGEDHGRRDILVGAIPKHQYNRALDIGCGDGFITQRLPAKSVVGLDSDPVIIQRAKTLDDPKISFETGSLFDVPEIFGHKPLFDLIVISGVLYPHYIADAKKLIYVLVDNLLMPGGVLAVGHIARLYDCRFPYLLLKELTFPYANEDYLIELYAK